MEDDTTFTGLDTTDFSEFTANRKEVTYTQVVSCAVGEQRVERRRQSLRARLEREQYERDRELQNSFISTFRSLFSSTRH